MRVPESAPLRGWRCGICFDYLEIATNHPAKLTITCERCDVAMSRADDSDLFAPLGSRYRSGNCRGCDTRIRLVPTADWSDFCGTCRSGQAAHRAYAAEHDWLPADPTRDGIADKLLSQAFGGPLP